MNHIGARTRKDLVYFAAAMQAASKYFLAWVPPEPVYALAWNYKNDFANRYGSKAALRSPPHITLHMPFLWKDKREATLLEALAGFARSQSATPVALTGFGCFAPRVIFIAVRLTDEIRNFQHDLHRFCRQHLQLFNAEYRDLAFHPHLTIAFRDLKKDAFREAWNEFQHMPFDHRFLADRLVLLRHDGSRWVSHQEFLLPSAHAGTS